MPRRINRRHLIASLIICTFFLVVCGIGTYRHTGKQQLNQRLAELREQGYPTTLNDLNALHGIPESADNAAPLYMQAIADYAGSTLGLPAVNKQLPLKAHVLEKWLHGNAAAFFGDS